VPCDELDGVEGDLGEAVRRVSCDADDDGRTRRNRARMRADSSLVANGLVR